ncbi:M48 family metalloprotease [Hymenobacter lutimineralis]|uniref:M48 family metalloprotease n=1 Tax=Hymenobacter lutimineralis TaxID=2606448 RepID=A0A5D6UQE0_9BACT|nr:M56 family metallopeptidase [Hymenobacter lutimineralis]TYZ05806.1 M48 family metalloprotease [Hymenobacter lutimineralis]
MNWLEQTLSPALVRALGWTLVHSLWQGAVVALALGGLLLLLRKHSADVRYRVAGLALGTMLLLATVTFARYYYAALTEVPSTMQLPADTADIRLAAWQPTQEAASTATSTAAVEPVGKIATWQQYFDQNLPVLVTAWLLGLLAMTLRLLGGLAYVQRLRHYRVQPLGLEWQRRLGTLAEKANLQRPVALLESALVRVPMVVGHLRPVILLPLGTVTGLSQTYLEAILAHELAHVARRDYLMNLVQSVAEILFFYHPAVWFVTATLRVERENCCDDTATALVGGNPLTLARALTALAELNLAPRLTPQLAMAAVGSRGTLLSRVRRLVQGRTAPTFTEGFMAACVVLGGFMLLSTAVALADPRPLAHPQNPLGTLLPASFMADDTTKQQVVSELAPQVAKVPAQVEVDELQEDDPKSRQKTKRGRANEQVVIVDAPAPGMMSGREANTVVIEKDKKGRVTNLMVNGQPVETASKAGRKGKTTTEVIRVAPNGYVFRNQGNPDFNFQFDNGTPQRFPMPGPSKKDMVKLRQLSRLQNGAGHTFSFNWENSNGAGADWQEQTREALRLAERKLDQAYREAETQEERDRIEEAQERLQERQERLREQQEELDEARHEGLSDQEQRQMDEAMRLHDEAMREHDREMRDFDREMLEHDRDMQRHDEELRRVDEARRREDNKLESALARQLLRDGLIKNLNTYQLSLNTREMMVNGKKQPVAVRDKYLRLFTETSGRTLKTGSFSITRQTNKNININYSGGAAPRPPQPPRPPRAPRVAVAPAPPAPVPFSAPAPPAPPAPPHLDSDEIRAELRKDGLLGATEKSFQFQLNDDGLTVNGKAQSAAMARKYRRLLDVPEPTPGQKRKQTVQISVSE